MADPLRMKDPAEHHVDPVDFDGRGDFAIHLIHHFMIDDGRDFVILAVELILAE